jgi:hypothetical protein
MMMRFVFKFIYMKRIICILLLSAKVGIAQNHAQTSEKPSTTDCPTWDNTNKPKSDADFYKSLRSRKPVNKTATTTSKPLNEPQRLSETKQGIQKTTEQPNNDTDDEIKNESSKANETEIIIIKEKTKEKPKRLPARKTTKKPRKKATSCPNF